MPCIFLATNTETTTLPSQFLNAKGDKYIIVRSCHAESSQQVYMCSDFITRDTYLDHFVCFVNTDYIINKRYKYNSAARSFSVWFKNIKGERLTLSNFVLELELVFV